MSFERGRGLFLDTHEKPQPKEMIDRMNLPDVVSREEWLAARKELLAREKELTRQKDALNTARRELPMVKIEKDYRFDGPRGKVGLLDLFQGCRQLALQHFMFDPRWDEGCPSCTADVDELAAGTLTHLRARETAFAIVSRAPLPKLEAWQAQRGWNVDWYSSFESDFNYDFHVTLDAAVAPVLHNYRSRDELVACGLEWFTLSDNHPLEQPGFSFFLRDGEDVFHTYSTFGRGTEALGGAYGILDLTALGRQENWELPKGRVPKPAPASPDFAESPR